MAYNLDTEKYDQETERVLALVSEMSFCPGGQLEFEDFRAHNADNLGRHAVQFVESWAKLMEAEMAFTGTNTLSIDAIKACAEKADIGGVAYHPGAFDWARMLLVRVWKYGNLVSKPFFMS